MGVRNFLTCCANANSPVHHKFWGTTSVLSLIRPIFTRVVYFLESFIVVNKHLLEDLVQLGLWNEGLKQEIMRANGSIQHVDVIPQDIKDLYKTVWELSMKDIIDMSRQRGYFIDQSQSLNLFMEGATMAKLTSMHFYAWKSGLKTWNVLLKNEKCC